MTFANALFPRLFRSPALTDPSRCGSSSMPSKQTKTIKRLQTQILI